MGIRLREKWFWIIGLFIIIMPVRTVSAGLIQVESLKNEGLYDDNIQVWISIVLIVLGIYTLVAGCFIYFHFQKPGSDKKQSKSKTSGGILIDTIIR